MAFVFLCLHSALAYRQDLIQSAFEVGNTNDEDPDSFAFVTHEPLPELIQIQFLR